MYSTFCGRTLIKGASIQIRRFESDVYSSMRFTIYGANNREQIYMGPISISQKYVLNDVVCDAQGYRFGFNGMEKDDEVKGAGNSLDFGARIYDSRLGRWLSLDPLMKKYPGISSYNFSFSSPLMFNDPDGKDSRVTVSRACASDWNRGLGGTVYISTIVHLYGADASGQIAQQLQNQQDLMNNTAEVVIDGKIWTVIVNVNYVYNQALDQAICSNGGEEFATCRNEHATNYIGIGGIQDGDNIMLVDRTLSNGDMGVSNNATGGVAPTSSSVKWRSIGTPGDGVHDVGHNLGFDERYTTGGRGSNAAPHAYFGQQEAPDFMSNITNATGFHSVHFFDLARMALNQYNPQSAAEQQRTGKPLQQMTLVNRSRVDNTTSNNGSGGDTPEGGVSIADKSSRVSNQRRTN